MAIGTWILLRHDIRLCYPTKTFIFPSRIITHIFSLINFIYHKTKMIQVPTRYPAIYKYKLFDIYSQNTHTRYTQIDTEKTRKWCFLLVFRVEHTHSHMIYMIMLRICVDMFIVFVFVGRVVLRKVGNLTRFTPCLLFVLKPAQNVYNMLSTYMMFN